MVLGTNIYDTSAFFRTTFNFWRQKIYVSKVSNVKVSKLQVLPPVVV